MIAPAGNTKVINLIAGPGAGKSTLAADLYARMKRNRMKVEMVREVAKEWVWQGREIGPFEQLAILGEQIHKESALFGKVDYVVTDSPVLLGAFYMSNNHNQKFANQFVKDYYNFAKQQGVVFLNAVLPRTKEYDTEGRLETKSEAIEIDERIVEYLDDHWYDYVLHSPHCDDDEIIKRILGRL